MLDRTIVERVEDSRGADEYEKLVLRVPESLLYMSIKYRNFLVRILPGSKPVYFIARSGRETVGVLPTFVSRNGVHGCVINSLPFYGSHGGILAAPDIRNPFGVRAALLEAWTALAEEERASASTMISSPFDGDSIQDAVPHDYADYRIGQITPLPANADDDYELREALFARLHQKTRNAIRKAEKSGVVISHSNDMETLRQLASLHQENMKRFGGRSKSWQVFSAIREGFEYDTDYRVYVATFRGSVVAVLLVFFFNRTAEYFTPATHENARVYQPMSLLVFHAMIDAIRRGCTNWNWGGTWATQTGVYRFKSRWGSVDRTYNYFTRLYDPHVLRLSPEVLLTAFPNFYVIPFKELARVSSS